MAFHSFTWFQLGFTGFLLGLYLVLLGFTHLDLVVLAFT